METTIGVRDLKTRASEIMRTVREAKAEYVITYHGRPCGILLPIDEEALEDYLLASHPFFAARREEAREEIRRGEVATPEELAAL